MCVEVRIIIVLSYFPREIIIIIIIIIIDRFLMYITNDTEDSHYCNDYNNYKNISKQAFNLMYHKYHTNNS